MSASPFLVRAPVPAVVSRAQKQLSEILHPDIVSKPEQRDRSMDYGGHQRYAEALLPAVGPSASR